MEKDIEEVLNIVEKPEFDKNDTSEQLIFKYLEYLKNIERARGLTDEQITAKYVNGRCENLMIGIANVLKTMDRQFATRKIKCKVPEGIENYVDGSHFVIELQDEKSGKSLYYDIRGKSDREFLNEFAENFYVKNTKYHYMAREEMSDYEMDEDIPDYAFEHIYGDLENSKSTENEIDSFRAQMEGYDELVTEQKFKLYDEAERLGVDFEKELDIARDKIALKNDMRAYFNGKKDITIEEINARCTELGLDFNIEMAKARDEKLPIATDIKGNSQKIADKQLSRVVQAGEIEAKKEYIEYENPNIDLDNKSIDN